jgi:hypothetical protein
MADALVFILLCALALSLSPFSPSLSLYIYMSCRSLFSLLCLRAGVCDVRVCVCVLNKQTNRQTNGQPIYMCVCVCVLHVRIACALRMRLCAAPSFLCQAEVLHDVIVPIFFGLFCSGAPLGFAGDVCLRLDQQRHAAQETLAGRPRQRGHCVLGRRRRFNCLYVVFAAGGHLGV